MGRVVPFRSGQQRPAAHVRQAGGSLHAGTAVKRFAPPRPFAADSGISRRSVSCRAIEDYMVNKLRAAEMTYKELQLKMGDPDVAGALRQAPWAARASTRRAAVGSGAAPARPLQAVAQALAHAPAPRPCRQPGRVPEGGPGRRRAGVDGQHVPGVPGRGAVAG
jgi:hypothetical protein